MIDDIFEGSLIVDSRNGIFCPQSFAERVDRNFFRRFRKNLGIF
jgi:hypothetical protein